MDHNIKKYITLLQNSSKPSELLKTIEHDILNNSEFLKWVAPHQEMIRELPVDSLTEPSAEFIFQQDKITTSLMIGCSTREDLCLIALKVYPDLVTYIPPKVRSPELYQKAVLENPEVFCNFPQEWRTKDYYPLILNNIQKCPQVVFFIPDRDQKLQLFKDVSDPGVIQLMFSVIELKDITLEMSQEAVSKNVRCFYRVPEDIKTSELCLTAYLQDEGIHKFVPERISKENNIYTFYRRLSKTLGKKLSLEDVKGLYNKMAFADVAESGQDKISIKWSESKRSFIATKTPKIKKTSRRKLP